MLEIKERVNIAICYANVIEDEAIDQILRMCDYPMTAGSRWNCLIFINRLKKMDSFYRSE